jgi:ESS family glutamate:Na+ symporter
METAIIDGVLQLKFDMLQAVALGVVMYYFGVWVRFRFPILVRLCVPAPVIGGLLVAFTAAILQGNGIVRFAFDNTLQQVAMILFFCTVGLNASYKLLLRGGLMVAAFWLVSSCVAVSQNAVNLPVAASFGLDPLMGIIAGSVPMIGGLGTAGAFGALFESEYGVQGALTAGIACATFGMVAGALIGGPLGEWIIRFHRLKTPRLGRVEDLSIKDLETMESAVREETGEMAMETSIPDEEDHVSGPHLMENVSYLLVACGIGAAVSYYLKRAGITLPPYLGAMMVGIAVRNIGDKSGWYKVDSKAVGMIGDIVLVIYITMAINSLQLIQLIDLALPLMLMMLLQSVLIMVIAYFLVFRLFGGNYDSAVMAGGLVGFGLGATPNALVCMQAITSKYGPSEKAFFVVPIVGAFLIDVSNSLIIVTMAGMLR